MAAWQEAEYFSEKEKSALALAEAVNLINKGHVPDEIYKETTHHWDDTQIAAIEWLSTIMGTFNRISITRRYIVKP